MFNEAEQNMVLLFWKRKCTSSPMSPAYRRTDRWTAWAHSSMVVWRSLSARGTKLLCIPAVQQQIQQIQGDFFSRLCLDLHISLDQSKADHSNWLFGDVFRQIEAELLTDAWICLPSSSVHLTGNSGTLTHILWGKRESVQSSVLRVEVGVYSQFYQIFPSEASPGFQLRSSSIPSICSTKTNQQLFGFIKEQTHPKPLPLGSCEIIYSEQPMAHKHFHHARLNIITKMRCKIHIQHVRTSTWTNPN